MNLATRTLGPKSAEEAQFSERRRSGRRREDLDSAYNDGAVPTSLGPLRGWLFYGGATWVLLTSVLGTADVARACWTMIAGYVIKH